MRPSKSHFVTSCQQLLALGAVLAVLTPAASVISLDVVRQQPSGGPGPSAGHGHPVELTAAESPRASRVPTAPVDAQVEEYPLTAPAGVSARPRLAARTVRIGDEPGTREVVSRPEPVVGFGGVGVTWDRTATIPEDELGFEVRSRTDDAWSDWAPLAYEAEHGPDPDSEEARHARPGTDVMFVGDVDQVQVRATADGIAPPAGMRLAVVSPGEATSTARQVPAAEEGVVAPRRASSSAPRPTIYTRRQWGANERLRDGFAGYGDISGGFVHHTVNSNDYTRAEVPGIIRSIYAYHTRSRGWSDIGYNFLVDRFGRIWEGRWGGIDRPVIGAHTLGYNEDSFAMSAIGNYETARPRDAMLRAYGALFAWKLGRYGIDPKDTSVSISGDRFQAINGHRDAGSTACPGRYLYAKLPQIRDYAEAATGPATPEVTVRQVDSDLAGTSFPDLVVRRASDGRGLIVPTGGLTRFVRPKVVGGPEWGSGPVLAVPDLTGDDQVDAVTFDRTGALEVRPGLPDGTFGERTRRVIRFRRHDLVASTGDLNGDSRADFVARSKRHLVAFLQNRRGGFRRVQEAANLRGYRQLVGAGDVTGDGRPDLWGRNRFGRIFLHVGKGRGAFSNRIRVPGNWSDVDWLAGGVDYTQDSVPDLIVQRANGTLQLVPARRDGTLHRPVGPVANRGLSRVSGAGQLTGGDAPDLLATRADGSLVVVRNRGTFDLGRPIDTGRSFRRGNLLLNAGDFTGDGHGDVIMRRRIGSLWLYQGDGTGRLAEPVWIAGRRPFRSVTGLRVVQDVTGDERPDVVGRLADGETVAWPGNGAERLERRVPVALSGGTDQRRFTGYDWVVETSDLRRRGRADLVARDSHGDVYRLNGTRRGYRSPRFLGAAGGYDLVG